MIENCARFAGMPVGPLALNDEVAIDLSWKIMDQARRDAAAAGQKFEGGGTEHILELMVKKLERFGRKNGKGFYEYPADGKKRLWPELAKHFPPIPSCSTARARTSAPRRTRSRSACSTCRRSTPRAASRPTC
jgi:3-hydroxyacyl-CoA dehydrogenase/enoyl-CoA hydratase/3-hydroxybutyryl-CoA epimerase